MEINYIIYAPDLADLRAVEPDDYALSEYRLALAKRLADAYPGAVVMVRVVRQRSHRASTAFNDRADNLFRFSPTLTGARVIDDDGMVSDDLTSQVTVFANQVLDELV